MCSCGSVVAAGVYAEALRKHKNESTKNKVFLVILEILEIHC